MWWRDLLCGLMFLFSFNWKASPLISALIGAWAFADISSCLAFRNLFTCKDLVKHYHVPKIQSSQWHGNILQALRDKRWYGALGSGRLASEWAGRRRAYLGEVPDQVAALAVILGEHVEEEGLHVVVQGLVVQKQLGQQTQVLTVDCAHVAVHLWGRKETGG